MDLRGRSLVKLLDHTPDEIRHLLDVAAHLRAAHAAGTVPRRLEGRTIALIFEKTSTRTRIAFEVAAYRQGAHVSYLGPTGTQIGHKESMRDTARVLGRVYDAIEYRGFGQVVVEELAAWAGVPVYNGLTDEFHPTQFLADALTMRDHAGRDPGEVSCCYLGDTRNNVGNSLLVGGALLGMDVRLCGPRSLWPDEGLVARCRDIASTSGARLTVTDDPDVVVPGADFLYTDVWVSMGEDPGVWDERIRLLRPYQVDARRMAQAGPDARFLHCLPAFHDQRTAVGREVGDRFGIDAMEVTDEVFESEASVVFDQAENRLHTIEAMLVETLRRD